MEIPLPSIAEIVAAFVPDVGQKPRFFDHFPQIAQNKIRDVLKSFILSHSPLAEDSRERKVTKTTGVSTPQISSHLMAECPWISLKFPGGPSDDVIRHLLSAPDLRRNASDKYRNEVHTKIDRGQNNRDENLPLVKTSKLL